jgi:serine/threonine-protein kinase
MVRYNWIRADTIQQEVKLAISKAIELDKSMGEAYAALGLYKIVFNWDLYGPVEDFQKAIRLNPNSAEIHALYAQYLRWMRRFDEGKVMARRAIELDPVTSVTNLWLGAIYFYEGLHDESIYYVNQTRKLDTTFIYANTHLAYAYTMKADTVKALYYADKAMSGNIYATSAVGSLGWTYAKCGETGKANEILDYLIKNRPDHHFYQALVYSGLGEYTKALDLLNQAYEKRSGTIIYLYAFSSNFFLEVSDDPRFIDLLNKIGFRTDDL